MYVVDSQIHEPIEKNEKWVLKKDEKKKGKQGGVSHNMKQVFKRMRKKEREEMGLKKAMVQSYTGLCISPKFKSGNGAQLLIRKNSDPTLAIFGCKCCWISTSLESCIPAKSGFENGPNN